MKPPRPIARPADPPDPGALLAWYDRHARRLPWRTGPGDGSRRPDPYRVWLSEIMLQQTTVAAVAPYFETFTRRWPTVGDLAAADLDEVMAAWAGLGYYARARRLKATAAIVAGKRGGRFPESAAALQELPGIGPYTAAAIAAIAFDEPAAVVDGNIERVLARVFAIDTPLPTAKRDIMAVQRRLTPRRRAGDYAQALMDLGATVCTPMRPACGRCPWSANCAAAAAGTQETLPLKAPKRLQPLRYGQAYVVTRDDGAVLVRRRPKNGLLGGMVEVPGSAWRAELPAPRSGRPAIAVDMERLGAPVRHTFTHFRLALTVWRGRANDARALPRGAWWVPRDGLAEAGLPTVMKKVVEAALPGATRRGRAG